MNRDGCKLSDNFICGWQHLVLSAMVSSLTSLEPLNLKWAAAHWLWFQTDWRTASHKPLSSSFQITFTNEEVTPTSRLFWWKKQDKRKSCCIHAIYTIATYNLQDYTSRHSWKEISRSSCARRRLIRQLHWKTRLFMRSVWIAPILSRQLLSAHKSSHFDRTMPHLNWQGSMGGNIITCRLHTNHTMFAFLKGGRALRQHDHFRDLHL